MNKEETIKDITTLLFDEAINYCNANGEIISENLAETLYKEGYRKAPDGAVILTPEERDEELKACSEKQAELEAEIERLKNNNESLKMWNDALTKGNDKLQKQNAIANIFLGQVLSHIDPDAQIDNYMQGNKAGAQEFAKELKAKKHCTFGESPFEDDCKEYVLISDIDELLKEYENGES